MTLFTPARETDAHPYWLPSEVRRRLVERKTGERSPLIRGADGSDSRQAVEFFRKSTEGVGVHLEALAGDEAFAARDLFAALNAGNLEAFVQVEAATKRLHPSYWEPRHDASTLTDTIFWGDDTVSNHPDRPVPVDHIGLAIMIPRAQATEWIGSFSLATPTVHLTGAERDAEYRRVAQALDAAGLPKRLVKTEHIAQHWPDQYGATPSVATIKTLMSGGQGGRPNRR